MKPNHPVEKTTPLRPLDLMRHIRDDDALRSTEKHVLHVATLRMDNTTGKVRASHEMLAADSGLSPKTVGRVMASPQAAIYVRTVDKRRGKDHWMRLPAVDTESSVGSGEAGTWVSNDGQSVQVGGLSVPNTGHSVHPSASTSTFPSAYSSAVSGEAAEKEGGEVTFRDPPSREGSDWRVQVWGCWQCGQGGTEPILYRTADHLVYECSSGYLVDTPYTAVPSDQKGLGAHYEVSADGRAAEPLSVVELSDAH